MKISGIRRVDLLTFIVATLLFAASSARSQADPPEQIIGERLFLETRFAQFFFANSGGNANATLANGDPVMDVTVTTNGALPGPFAGQSMNCRVCHLVDEHNGPLGNRTYCDFARRSPIPDRGDGRTVTPRNSPALVNAMLARKNGLFLHFDGEFSTARDLVKATLTGRNYGWLATEKQQAIAHVAHIIREDDGSGELAQSFGGAYRVVLAGTRADIPPEFRLPRKFRINVATASDKEILEKVAALVEAYMQGLVFAQDEEGEFAGSPYDVFLQKNGLPRTPAKNETTMAYGRRLLDLINDLQAPQFVSDSDGAFTTRSQAFQFGETELAGLKIFLTPSNSSLAVLQSGRVGNCVACHAPPAFTDFGFHNTGATQEEYDSIHGEGAFALLQIPSLAERHQNHDAFLQPTPKHPGASGIFLAAPSAEQPGKTDLGVWNVFANPDIPRPQGKLRHLLHVAGDSPAEILPQTIARFKTPGLRDLGHSAPYLHTGRMDSLEDVVEFYRQFAGMSRTGSMRNPAPELQGMVLTTNDIAPLAAFLRSLNEDYE